MTLVGVAGVRTGVPFPVLARSSFGTFGANIPALVRGLVACFWYGAQTAAASGALVALMIRCPGCSSSISRATCSATRRSR